MADGAVGPRQSSSSAGSDMTSPCFRPRQVMGACPAEASALSPTFTSHCTHQIPFLSHCQFDFSPSRTDGIMLLSLHSPQPLLCSPVQGHAAALHEALGLGTPSKRNRLHCAPLGAASPPLPNCPLPSWLVLLATFLKAVLVLGMCREACRDPMPEAEGLIVQQQQTTLGWLARSTNL